MRKIFCCLLLAGLSLQSFAEEIYPAATIPAPLKAGANAVIREMETTVNMLAMDHVVLHVKKAITILNKNGEDHAELQIYYNKNTTVRSLKGLIYNAEGFPVNKFSLSNFIDESAISDFSLYEDERIKHYTPAVISYPYTVVYDYEVLYKQNLIIPDWYANPYPDEAVMRSSYDFSCKPEDEIRIQEKNYPGKGTCVKTDKLNTYHWEVENQQAFKKEPFSPPADNYRTYVKISPLQFSYYKSKGNFSNWNELGKWVYNDLLKSRQVLAPEVVKEIKDLVANVNTDKEKARKIYEYLQKRTRYISVQVGLGGFQPMFANDVHRLGYGDCKALVNYMQTLLNAVNIKSEYCVVYAGRSKQSMDPDYASMDQGNHIILCLPFEKDTTWLECTSQVVPFGFLGDFTDDRTVLACTAEGGKLLHTPNLTAGMNLTKRTAELRLDSLGNVEGKLLARYKGAQFDTYTYMLTKAYPEQLKLLKSVYEVDNINFEGLKFKQDTGNDPYTEESFNLSIPNYASRGTSMSYLVVNAFNRQGTVSEVRDRKLPVHINRGFTDEDELVYHLPEKFHIDYKPKDVSLKNEFGSYTAEYVQKGQDLIYKRTFVLNAGTYPAAAYTDFAAFLNKASLEDGSKVIFKRN